jgi:hypothetical protein
MADAVEKHERATVSDARDDIRSATHDGLSIGAPEGV